MTLIDKQVITEEIADKTVATVVVTIDLVETKQNMVVEVVISIA